MEDKIEVEMKELIPGEAQDNKDEEKGKMDETKEAETKKGKEEVNVYCKPNNPQENVYSLAMPTSSPEHKEDVYRRVRLYKWISTIFIILSLLLLAVVLALALKLSEVQSNEKCPDLIAEVKKMHNYTPNQAGCQCSVCDDDWEKFENSCYFFSKERRKWQESREACQKQGGDLVVIDNERVQRFLNENGNMLYWIGLHYSEEQQWMWINSTAPTP
ncbi:hypothetical protein QTP86_020522, partial [Hemibagrus guttatus]